MENIFLFIHKISLISSVFVDIKQKEKIRQLNSFYSNYNLNFKDFKLNALI